MVLEDLLAGLRCHASVRGVTVGDAEDLVVDLLVCLGLALLCRVLFGTERLELISPVDQLNAGDMVRRLGCGTSLRVGQPVQSMHDPSRG
jgi:hypothetical protein